MAGVRTIKRGKRIPKETQEALVQAYISDKNCTICQICQRFGVSEEAARRILRSHGVEVRMIRKPWEPQEDEMAYRMYHEGARLSTIARALGRPVQSLKHRLRKMGLIEPATPKKKKDKTLNPEQLSVGKIYKARIWNGGDDEADFLGAIKLVYLGKHGRHHLFQSRRGKWKTAFTDVQLTDLSLEEG